MIFQSYRPNYPLDRFIDSLFYFEGFSPAHALDRFLPDGNTEIIFDLTENTQYIYDNETLVAIQAFQQFWGNRPNPPAISVMFVAGLAHPDFLAEMDAIAVIPE